MQAVRLPARYGLHWFAAGLRLFRANPFLLSALTFLYFAIILLLLQLPIIGQVLVPPLLPVLALILGNGCRAIARGEQRPLHELFTGCAENRQSLIRLGLLQLAGSMLIVGLALGLGLEIDPLKPEQSAPALLALLALSLPLLLAFWFSPLLVGWHGTPALKAVFFSLVGCLRNGPAMVFFALTLLAVFVLLPGLAVGMASTVSADFAQLLGKVIEVVLLAVAFPAINATAYLAYRDIFVDG